MDITIEITSIAIMGIGSMFTLTTMNMGSITKAIGRSTAIEDSAAAFASGRSQPGRQLA